jgi:hypothetical protein
MRASVRVGFYATKWVLLKLIDSIALADEEKKTSSQPALKLIYLVQVALSLLKGDIALAKP